MKKEEYIAKYGEEAWAVESSRRSECRKRYYQKHKNELKEYGAQYRKEHKEEIKQQQKKWREENHDYMELYRQEHKEELKEHDRQYKTEHKEQIKEQQREYNKEHKKERNTYLKQYRSTKTGKANRLKKDYNHRDKERGFDISLNVDSKWIVENIFKSACIYCGESDWTKLGADRIDNTKGHTPDNVVCCCGKCNVQKGRWYSVEEFVLIKKKEKGGA